MSSTVGRYAPSPSGRMHLGNLCCCLLAWLSAKSSGGKVVLRIDDLDAVRCPREFADLLEADLAWLGLAADEGGSKGGPRGPYYQSERSAIYEEYYQKLVRKGLVYPCFCSRSQLHAADAPHRSDGKVVYAGTCRNLTPAEIAERAKTRANRDLSAARMAARATLAAQRQKIADETFSKAREQLAAFVAGKDYAAWLQKEAASLAETLGENAKITARAADLPLLKNVELPAGTVLEADDSITLGGLKGANPAKGVAADDTLEARLEAQHDWFLENAGLEINI